MGRLNYQVGDRINPFYAVPVGTILPFAGSSIPAGWLECAGQVLSRATYPDLFAVIGTTYGAATPETFNLPDLRGEFLRGWDNGKGVDVGRALGSFQAEDFKGHSHSGSTSSAGSHTHTQPKTWTATNLDSTGGPYPVGSDTNGSLSAYRLDEMGSAGAHTHTVTIGSAGGSETRPRNVAVRFCIRAFGSIENSGLIDVGALAVEVSDAVKIGDFIGGNQSKATNGYQKLPGGLILQWGEANSSGTSIDVTWPIAFPNSCFQVLATDRTTATPFYAITVQLNLGSNALSGASFYASNIFGQFSWLAIGY